MSETFFVKGNRNVLKEDSGIYWWFVLMLLLYIGLLFGQWVTIQNASSLLRHDYFTDPNAPGATLFSTRYTSRQAISLELLATRIFFIIFIGLLLVFKDDIGWNYIWFVLACVIFFAQLSTFCLLCYDFGTSNKSGYRYNLGSTLWFCCDPVIHANSDNACRNPLPCDLPVPPGYNSSQFVKNGYFLWLFWVNFVLFIIDIFVMVMLILIWKLPAKFFNVGQKESQEETPKEESPTPSAPPEEKEEEKEGEKEPLQTKIAIAPLRQRVVSALGGTMVQHGLKKTK